jgi:hypothetical protein
LDQLEREGWLTSSKKRALGELGGSLTRALTARPGGCQGRYTYLLCSDSGAVVESPTPLKERALGMTMALEISQARGMIGGMKPIP